MSYFARLRSQPLLRTVGTVAGLLLVELALCGMPGRAETQPDSYEVDDAPSQARRLEVESAQYRNLHTADDVDWVRFRISQTSQVAVEASNYSGSPSLTLYGPNSSSERVTDEETGSDARVRVSLLQPGEYYVRVEARNGSPVDQYTLRLTTSDARDAFEPDDTSGSAKRLLSGTTQNRSFHAPGDVDWARFTLPVRGDVTLATNGPTGDTVMILYGPDSSTREVVRDDDHGNGLFSKISRKGLPPGDYYVRVTERGGDQVLPAYTLRLTTEPSGDTYEPDDTADRAKVIAPNSSQQRSLDVAADVDWVRFTLLRQSTVTVATSGAAGDTELALYGPGSSSALIAQDDNGGTGGFSRLQAPLLPGGVYYLRVRAHPGTSALPAYTLSVQAEAVGDLFEPDNSAEQGTLLEAGTSQARSLDPVGDVDWVRFTLTRESYVTLETSTPVGATELALFREGSTSPLVVEGSVVGTARVVVPQLPAGSYQVRVRNPQDVLVSGYLLALQVSDAFEPDDTPEAARPLALEEPQEHNLHRPGDVDWVRFTLPAASALGLQITAATGPLELALFAEGQLAVPIAAQSTGGEAGFRLPIGTLPPGSYLVRVGAPGDAGPVARYRLSARLADAYEPDDSPEAASEIALGSPQQRSLPTAADVDWVRFTLTAPARVTIETSGPSGDTELLLYAEGKRRKLAANNNGGVGKFSRLRKKLPAGTYLIQVRPFRGRGSVPAYTLTVSAQLPLA